MPAKINIAIVVSHPIQHFCPQYVSFAQHEGCRVKVFFGSALGFKQYTDHHFKQEISWGNLQLEKFEHIFLNGDAVLQADKDLDAATLEKELENFDPAIVIVYGYFQKLQRRAYHWATQQRLPIAYISDSESRQQRSLIKTWVKGILLRRYFSKIKWFLSVGDANEAFYRSHGINKDRLVRMHFSIDVAEYKRNYEQKAILREKIRTQYDIAKNEIVLSVVGKLSPWKNQDHLVDVVRLLESRGVYVTAFILGSGEMKEAWEEKAKGLKKSKIYFPGFVAIDLLPAYYAATDIYVHPASVEPHSIAVSEAIFMGCPVIVSDRTGSHGETDDVQEGKNGFVFEFGNIPQLADKIERLVMDSNQRAQFGAYSHQVAVEFQQQSHHTVLERLLMHMNNGNA